VPAPPKGGAKPISTLQKKHLLLSLKKRSQAYQHSSKKAPTSLGSPLGGAGMRSMTEGDSF